MLNKPVNPKIIGYVILLPSLVLFLCILIAIFIVPAFGHASGVSFWAMIPFFLIALFFLAIASFSIYLAYKYVSNSPIEKNETLGTLFVFGSIGFVGYGIFNTIMSHLVGNEGGYAQLIIALLFLMIFFPIGLGLKNGYSNPS